MHRSLIACVALALAACSPPPAATRPAAAPASAMNAPMTAPAGAYTADMAHSTLLFRANHMGFSHFTGRFTAFTIDLRFDPAHPETSAVSATVDPASLALDNPPAGFLSDLKGPQWLDAAHFPRLTYSSTSVEVTGANSARITGDLTLHGQTHPVVLEATYNGGYPGMELDPHARIGFSAHGVFKRSDFAIAYGIPEPGSNMGVSDEVEVIIESELNGPAWAGRAATTP